MSSMKTIILEKCIPNGGVRIPEYYWYSGDISSSKKIDDENIPRYKARNIETGRDYGLLPVCNGWLLDFYVIGVGKVKWAIFSLNGELIVDTGKEKLHISKNHSISVSHKILCFTAIIIRNENVQKTLYLYTPILRYMLADPQIETGMCEPLVYILNEVSSDKGMLHWVETWEKGISHRNMYIEKVA